MKTITAAEANNTRCRVCDGSKVQEWLYPREMMFGMREKFSYFRCLICGCLQLEKIPENLGKYYPDNYYSYENPKDVHASLGDYFKRKFIHPLMAKHILGWKSIPGHIFCHLIKHPPVPVWLRFLTEPVPVGGGVLDVGCGSGLNLLMLRDCGFTNLLGVDPFISKPLVYSGGLRIEKCDLQAVQGKFSLIMFHHVFEHLPNPLETLCKARQLLSPGGQILIRIPLSDSLAAKKYKENWVQLDAPRHITLQTRRSIAFAAEKCSLTIKKIVYDSSEFQFYGSELYVRDITGTSDVAKIFSEETMKFYREKSRELNDLELGDMAAFCLAAL